MDPTQVEQQLSELWCKLLKLEQITVGQSVFQLGVYSLVITQFVQQVNEIYGLDLRLPFVFLKPSIKDQAAEICRMLTAAGTTRTRSLAKT